MKLGRAVKYLTMACLSMSLLTACPETKKTDDTSTTDGDTGGGGGGGTSPTPTPTPSACDSPGSGFTPTSNGGYISNLTAGTTISAVKFYFMDMTTAGSYTVTVTAVGCGFGGATLGTSTGSVNLAMTYNYYSKTFTFSPAITVPDCGSGTGIVGFLFSNPSRTTAYAGAQHTTNTTCEMTVANSVSGTPPTAHPGVYSYSGTYTTP